MYVYVCVRVVCSTVVSVVDSCVIVTLLIAPLIILQTAHLL